MLMNLDILFKKGARKITRDNFCIGVEFSSMPMKDLLILVKTHPENLKVFGQLSPEFDADKRKTTLYGFQSKTMTVSPYVKPISAMQLARVTKVKKILKTKRREM